MTWTLTYQLPATVSCDTGCVLQWRYFAMQVRTRVEDFSDRYIQPYFCRPVLTRHSIHLIKRHLVRPVVSQTAFKAIALLIL
jgi:hypothetical protein